jgi:para-aminobenzoate synthetase component 1
MIDFEMKRPLIRKIGEIDPDEILFDINGTSNQTNTKPAAMTPSLSNLRPVSLDRYRRSFNRVSHHLDYGDSYLTNLTFKTEVESSTSLRDIFFNTRAKYKVLYRNEFLVFSPEIFVQLRDGMIYSYPMKGTIDASIPGARDTILEDKKELAEHVTIVDLIRNDLSQVATNVMVTRFRYVDEIRTRNKNLLQVSSEIVGRLPEDYQTHLGDIVAKLLPAGSISGAPKEKTLEIIREAE